MRPLVLRYGRGPVLAGLVTILLLGCGGLSLGLGHWVRAEIRARSPISPAEALDLGGQVVRVRAYCGETRAPMIEGGYEVLTESGRPPQFPTGDLTDNLAEVVVGPDWIGRISIRQDRDGRSRYEDTGLIGAVLGWDERHVLFHSCE